MSSDNVTHPSGVATNEGEESLLAPSLNEDSGLDLILNPDLLSVPSNSQSAFSSGNTTPDTERSCSVSSLLVPTSISSAITDSQSSLSSNSSSVAPSRDKSAEGGGAKPIRTGSSGRSDRVQSPFGFSGTLAEIELPIIIDPQSRQIGSFGAIPTSKISMINDPPDTIPSSEISITDPQSMPFGSSGTIPSTEISITDSQSRPLGSSDTIPSSEINITDPQSRLLGSFDTIPAIELPMNIDSQSSLTSTSEIVSLSSGASTLKQSKLPSRPTSITVSLRRTYHEFSTEATDGILQAKTYEDPGVKTKKIRTSERENPPTTTKSTSSLSSRESGSITLSTSSSAESRDTSSLNLTCGSSDTPEDTKDDWYHSMRTKGPRVRVSTDGTIEETEFGQTEAGGTSSTAEAGKFLSVQGDICANIYFGRVSPSLNEEARQDENKSVQNKDVGDSDANQDDENRDKNV